MAAGLEGVQVAVLGGDDRELVLMARLQELGSRVVAAGFPARFQLKDITTAITVEDAFRGSQAVIMPMPGTDDKGVIRAIYAEQPLVLRRQALALLPAGTPVTIGVAQPFLRQWAKELRLNLVEVAEVDELAIYNAVPTAEGAIQIAMDQLPITIHGSESFVLGFGRVGLTLARMLQGIGARVTVVARNHGQKARAWEMGYTVLDFPELAQELPRADIVYNTVPSLVLDARLLERVKPEGLIIDLATQPGGTDFEAASSLRRKAILAPGLPGKVAPLTAGRILARVIPPLIAQMLQGHQAGGAQ